MASDYCYGKEMGRVLERHRAKACRVIPILLRPTYWDGAPFSGLQLLPTDARPVTSWPDRYEAFHDVVQEISRVIKDQMISPKTTEDWLEEGIALYELKRYEEALTAYEQAVRLDPNFAEPYSSKGALLCELKRYREALASCEEAIRLDPKNAQAYHKKGVVLYGLPRYEEALLAAQQAIRLDPNFVQASTNKDVTFINLLRK
jgi:tetratricopeptide (TPR) repeat protein